MCTPTSSSQHARKAHARHQSNVLVVFPTRLGWMALVGWGAKLKYLTFGHRSPEGAARRAANACGNPPQGDWNRPLVRRLQAYAGGACDNLIDVEVDLTGQTDFQRRILRLCRQIPFGRTLSYGQLAARAGSPGAARAVGRCMASNPVPLVIPCHRVVAARGRLGGYSAIGGLSTKRRLLAMEAQHLTRSGGETKPLN